MRKTELALCSDKIDVFDDHVASFNTGSRWVCDSETEAAESNTLGTTANCDLNDMLATA